MGNKKFTKMKEFKILKDEEVLNEVSMDNLKGGCNDSAGECCTSNNACNVNSKQIEKAS
ncbi:hypothetical protein IX307_002329 [Bacteroides pyogenes]|nr:hypothetical protein [Bacteroides pyogenes]MBR8726626.1 hypothetical protein [Bacteroides pyogenes]MBR8739998.1 hypothetical protein [Bacteroides pyogenes]MBR8755768.1 hypothetical protein [Bacteroides pyogenes]MBR8787991.1 hypothetical protein [Bacteroides pyogenes]